MRIAVAEIAQETDSFSPLRADLKDFEAHGLYLGRKILDRMPGVGPLGGFLEVAAGQGTPVDLVPIIRAWGSAGGAITRETLDFLTARLVEGLRQSPPLDGVFLSLHGAAEQPAPPHMALVDRGRPSSQTGRWPWQRRLRAAESQADRSPRCAR